MFSFNNIPIRFKLIVIQVISSFFVIITTVLIFLYTDYKSMEKEKVESLNSISKIIASNCVAPILFEDDAAAVQILSELRVEPEITHARVLHSDGGAFADYKKPDEDVYFFSYDPTKNSYSEIDGDELIVYQKIFSEEDWIGTVCIRSDISQLQSLYYEKTNFAYMVMFIAVVLAIILASILQKNISRPVEGLVKLMENIKKENDYELRSSMDRKDEIGMLAAEFNRMLDQIQRRDKSLSKAKSELEIKVEKRTRELKEKNEDLVVINKELEKAKELADLSRKSKEQFLATMSHEIRTPLNAIIGFQQLLKDTPLNKEQLEYVDSIDFAGKNLLVVINDILDISKIEAGKLELEKAPMSITDIVSSVVELIRFRASEKNLEVITEIDSNIPVYVIGDNSRLSQILINLLGNAVKFTHEGYIKMGVHLIEEDEDSAFYSFIIEDTGIGIPEDKIPIIFDRFTQVSSDTTRKYGGTGLGLTIVKELVRIHDGEIDVESTPDVGSTFIVKIRFQKLKDLTLLKKDEELFTNRIPGKKLKVLLAEDIELNQKLIKRIMKKWGHDLDVAENGKIAYELVCKNDYDIILMDIRMPVMDGYRATELIREIPDERKSQIPIVALTARASNPEAERCFNIGMNAYISKPFDVKYLLDTIYKLTMKQEVPKEIVPPKDKSIADVEKLYDLGYISEHSGGDKKFIQEMLEIFLHDVPEVFSEFEAAESDNDFIAQGAAAHRLKNLGATLGMKEAIKLSAIIEEASGKEDDGTIRSHYPRLKELFELVMQIIRNEHLHQDDEE